MSAHTCHALGCRRRCPPEYLMCGPCWATVPKRIQTLVWNAYTPGQCDGGADIRPEWHDAADKAIAAAAIRSEYFTPAQAQAWLAGQQGRAAPTDAELERELIGQIGEVAAQPIMAITVHQPWAELLALGLKDVENRGWETDYRGALAIHAGLRWVEGDVVACLDELEAVEIITRAQRPSLEIMRAHLGHVIGVGDMFDCSPADTHPSAWAIPGSWAFSIRSMRRLPDPVRVRGERGLFELQEPALLDVVTGLAMSQACDVVVERMRRGEQLDTSARPARHLDGPSRHSTPADTSSTRRSRPSDATVLISEDTPANRIELVNALEVVTSRAIVTKADALAALDELATAASRLRHELGTW